MTNAGIYKICCKISYFWITAVTAEMHMVLLLKVLC